MTAFTLELIGLAAVMSVVIAFLLVFLKLFGKRFTAKCRYIIWAAVILRLCIPVGLIGLSPIFELSVPESVSIPRTASVTQTHVPDNPVVPVTPPETVKTPVQPEPSPSPAAPKTEVHSDVQPTVGGNITPIEKPAVTPEVKRSTDKTLDVKKLLPTVGMIWLAVSGAILFVRLVSYAIYTARLRRRGAFREADGELLDIYLTLGREMKIRRLPKLSVTEYKANPFLYGFISPRIVMPESALSCGETKEILAHELTHYKRGDLFEKLACAVVKSLYFFDPLVYAAAGRCVRELELSCDEAVLKNCNEEERLEYGNAMLGIVSTLGHVRSSELTSSFNPKHGALKERIMNICDTSKKKRGIIITAAVLVVCIFAGSIVGATMIKDVDRGNNSKETENPAVVMTTEDTTAETEPETTVPETTVPETTAVPEPVTEPEELMPYGDYVGIWYVNETMEDTIGVYSCSENEIEFTTGIFRTFGFRDTAKYSDGAYRFGDGVSDGYSGPAGVN